MLIDLTMELAENVTPTHPIHGRSPVFTAGTLAHDRLYPGLERPSPYDGSYVSYENANVLMCDHTGTHMDAALHGDPDGEPIGAMPLAHGFGEAVWLDLSAHFGDGAEISAGDLEAAEAAGGEPVRDGDILLVWTGWSTVLPDAARYVAGHVGLTRDGAEWVRGHGVRTLGIDSPTPDTVAGARVAAVHMNFLRPGGLGASAPVIAIIENLVGIDRIPTRRFRFSGLPLPLRGLTGSPIRAVAEAVAR